MNQALSPSKTPSTNIRQHERPLCPSLFTCLPSSVGRPPATEYSATPLKRRLRSTSELDLIIFAAKKAPQEKTASQNGLPTSIHPCPGRVREQSVLGTPLTLTPGPSSGITLERNSTRRLSGYLFSTQFKLLFSRHQHHLHHTPIT